MYRYLIVLFAVIQTNSAQTTDMPEVSYICGRTAGTTVTNYIEVIYKKRGATDDIINMYVVGKEGVSGCSTKTYSADNKLTFKLDGIQLASANSPVCDVTLTADGTTGALNPTADIIFYLTKFDSDAFGSKDYMFTIVKADCDVTKTAATEQTVKNVQLLKVTGEPGNKVTPTQAVEDVTLAVVKTDATTNQPVEVVAAVIGDKVKIQITMALPSRSGATGFSPMTVEAYSSCDAKSTDNKVVLVKDYCAVATPAVGITDATKGFVGASVGTTKYVSTMTSEVEMFMFSSSVGSLCFVAKIEFCSGAGEKCTGDTCENKGKSRTRRDADNSTSVFTVTSKIYVSKTGTPSLKSSVQDCQDNIHAKVFLPVVIGLAVLLVASLSTTVYVCVSSRRVRKDFPMTKLSEQNI